MAQNLEDVTHAIPVCCSVTNLPIRVKSGPERLCMEIVISSWVRASTAIGGQLGYVRGEDVLRGDGGRFGVFGAHGDGGRGSGWLRAPVLLLKLDGSRKGRRPWQFVQSALTMSNPGVEAFSPALRDVLAHATSSSCSNTTTIAVIT